MQAWDIWCAGRCLELMDPTLIKSFIASEVFKCLHIGLLCVQQDAADRPTMSTVVLMLGSDTMTLPRPNHPAFSVGKLTPKETSTSGSFKNPSINDVTVSALLARILIIKAQTQTYLGSNCQNTTQEHLSSAYQTNLDKILTWMSSDASTSRGYNHTSIGINSTVYGLYDCRGDVVGYFCQFCVSFAAREAPKRCPNSVSAMVWYEYCILRYSNEKFFGDILTHPTWHGVGTKNVSNMAEIKKGEGFVRSLIRKAATETNQLYYLGGFSLSSTQRRYGMVHCSRDLTNEGCTECLEAVLAQVPKCCEQKIGWFIWSGTCMIRYDDQMFYLLNNQTSSLTEPNLQTVYIASGTGEELEKSTDNFSEASKLGEGGFGNVYKGILADGTQIAVKRLSKFSGQGSEEFNNEVMFIANLQHRNLVRLLAYCLDENENILVYEYLPNKSLDFHLFDGEKRNQFDWKLRLRIINGIARDFGLARAFEIGQKQANTKRVMGTYGYMAPEYVMQGLFSVKSDVFSFGVLVLEIIWAEAQTNLGGNCGNGTQQNLSSAYQTNLDKILTWMSSDAATSNGYNHTTIGTNSSAYGLYDCGGGVVGYFCQFCVSTATKEAAQLCPSNVSALVWNDYCVIRYSNEDFFGKALTYPTWHTVGTKNVSNITEIQKGEDFVRSLIRKATNESNLLYYKDGFNLSATESRYGVVQCTRDLTNEGCRQCLEDILAEVPTCCEQKVAWMVWSGSCLIKYDDHIFYLLNQPPSAPAPDQQTEGIPLPSFHKFQSEETWNTDLPRIPLITILQSTDKFSEASKLGEGGFGPVYKGTLPDGRQIAVKRLSKFSGQGSEEFNNEVMFIAKLRHRNLVRLLACCLEENEKILVYEYLPNKSLDFHLFGMFSNSSVAFTAICSSAFSTTKIVLAHKSVGETVELNVVVLAYVEKRKQFYWKLRLSIINGIARDFGLARAFEMGQNQANTKRVMGTYGYMAPEYAMEGLFSVKSDVFSFGVLVLEIICGRKNGGFYLSDGQTLLLYGWRKWCEGKCLEMMDPMLEKSFIGTEVERCIQIGLLCVQEGPKDRPTMSDVVVMLASDTVTLPKPKHPAFSVGSMASEEVSTSRSSKNFSNNDITSSITLPR
ncbi:unnamed protein product [Sphenostylis stenocarpa]|uniref:Uncharacterized protein n=1 Tax=Sphenostylis stenocarpa TaxID=92480 RepID=A0AA86W3L5_9FABA|nr:unnamed protein product [Sphenostylis stenocarpa]